MKIKILQKNLIPLLVTTEIWIVLYTVWYNNILIVIVGVCVFGIASGLDFKKCSELIGFISKYSFGVFLIHNPINMILIKMCLF